MNKENIVTFIINTLSHIINNKEITVKYNTKINTLSLDKLDYTQLIIECEEHFDVLIDDTYFESLETIDDIANYVLLETEKNIIN